MVVIAFVVSMFSLSVASQNSSTCKDALGEFQAVLVVGGDCFSLEVVDTEHERITGLSGRDNLRAYSGMLFEFPATGNQCMWMQDMKFPIDILWLDDNYIVQQAISNVEPSSYPETFCSDHTKYVIELPADISHNYRIRTGDRLNLIRNR